MKIDLRQGDSLAILKQFEENTIDSICCDPPYAIGFMNRGWDSADNIVVKPDIWKECLRVLKPGGHLMAFSHSRTFHRVWVAIEDAGFEVRDTLAWIYGSGFPKSHNIGKYHTKFKQTGKNRSYTKTGLGDTNGRFAQGGQGMVKTEQIEIDSEWEGWGTALKPALEPICLARKPLSEKTVLANVLKWGVGALNIDASRVGIEGNDDRHAGNRTKTFAKDDDPISGGEGSPAYIPSPEGRFPANVIHDGSDEVLEVFPDTKSTGTGKVYQRKDVYEGANSWEIPGKKEAPSGRDDSGSAARYFYCAKVNKKERNAGLDGFESTQGDLTNQASRRGKCQDCGGYKFGDSRNHCDCENPTLVAAPVKNPHPTVKPIALMEHLVKMITPKGGTVLDPFMGSGSTGCAAVKNDFDFIGIDLSLEYVGIAEARIMHWKDNSM